MGHTEPDLEINQNTRGDTTNGGEYCSPNYVSIKQEKRRTFGTEAVMSLDSH